MIAKINNLREKLHRELDKKVSDKKRILEISQELDKLIIEYLNQKELE